MEMYHRIERLDENGMKYLGPAEFGGFATSMRAYLVVALVLWGPIQSYHSNDLGRDHNRVGFEIVGKA